MHSTKRDAGRSIARCVRSPVFPKIFNILGHLANDKTLDFLT
ncbi:hypothetical protein QUB63_14235 [Microcoleus sp. ARI1-B5]